MSTKTKIRIVIPTPNLDLAHAYTWDWWRRVRDMLRRRRPRGLRGPRCPAPAFTPADLGGVPWWRMTTYMAECLAHPLGPPFPLPARAVAWRWAAVLGLVAIAVLPGCGGEDFDPDTDPKNPNCGETSEECG